MIGDLVIADNKCRNNGSSHLGGHFYMVEVVVVSGCGCGSSCSSSGGGGSGKSTANTFFTLASLSTFPSSSIPLLLRKSIGEFLVLDFLSWEENLFATVRRIVNSPSKASLFNMSTLIVTPLVLLLALLLDTATFESR